MAQPFALSPLGDNTYVAYLTTGERLFIVRAAADVVELLGEEDVPGMDDSLGMSSDPFAFPTNFHDDFSASDAGAGAGAGAGTGAGAGEVRRAETDGDDDAPTSDHSADAHADDAHAAENLERVLAALSTQEFPFAPTDPAVRRLLPDASLNPEIAAEFRKFTDFELREQKVQRLLMLSGLLTEVDPSSDDNEHLPLVVRADEAEQIASALGDIRLVLGERLDLHSDEEAERLHNFVMTVQEELLEESEGDDELDEDTERRYIMGILFELAGYLQESLVECLLTDLRARRRQRP